MAVYRCRRGHSHGTTAGRDQCDAASDTTFTDLLLLDIVLGDPVGIFGGHDVQAQQDAQQDSFGGFSGGESGGAGGGASYDAPDASGGDSGSFDSGSSDGGGSFGGE